MRAERARTEMECLAEGIREQVDTVRRVEAVADQLDTLERIAGLSKRLRTLCNRERMELQRMNLDKSNPTTPQR